jgi:hypothetical protein
MRNLAWASTLALVAAGLVAGFIAAARPAEAAAPPATHPGLFVSAGGSDAGRCTRGNPCRSFARAYALAKPGQIVEVAGGSYPKQEVGGTKPGSRRVVFRPRAGAKVTLEELKVHADNLEVRSIAAVSFHVYEDSTAFMARNLDVGWFEIFGSKDTSIIGGDVGPSLVGGEFHTAWITFGAKTDDEPRNLLIDGVRFHDFTRAKEGDHTQCIFMTGGNGITIRNSRFVRCDVFSIFAGTPWWKEGLPPLRNVTIENNVFDASTWGGSYDCCSYAIRFAGDWPILQNFRFAYNSSKMPMSFGDSSTPRSNFQIVGNVMPNDGCGAGETYAHNVLIGGPRCSPTDRRVPTLAAAGFVAPNAREPDLRLKAASPAVDAGDPNSHPRRDISGSKRPRGRGPDAGAYER